MNTKIKKEEVVTNINQPQQTEKNIEYLMRESKTILNIMENTKQEFIELKRTLNKTLNELLESHHLTYGKDRVITNRCYGEKINRIYGQID
jgi:hypothetical protein